MIVAEKNKVARRIAQVLSGGRYRVRRIYRVPVYEFELSFREENLEKGDTHF